MRSDGTPPISELAEQCESWRKAAEAFREELRDRFAMAALTGLVFGRKELISTFVKEAYQIADAMMEQRDISRTCGTSD